MSAQLISYDNNRATWYCIRCGADIPLANECSDCGNSLCSKCDTIEHDGPEVLCTLCLDERRISMYREIDCE